MSAALINGCDRGSGSKIVIMEGRSLEGMKRMVRKKIILLGMRSVIFRSCVGKKVIRKGNKMRRIR